MSVFGLEWSTRRTKACNQQFMDEKDTEEFLWLDVESTLSQACCQNDNHGNEYDLISKETYEYVLEKLQKERLSNEEYVRFY